MKIKVKDILAANPCQSRKEIFLASLKKGQKEVTMKHILKSNDLGDVFWVIGRVLKDGRASIVLARQFADRVKHLTGNTYAKNADAATYATYATYAADAAAATYAAYATYAAAAATYAAYAAYADAAATYAAYADAAYADAAATYAAYATYAADARYAAAADAAERGAQKALIIKYFDRPIINQPKINV